MNKPVSTDTPRDVPVVRRAPREDILVSVCLAELPELHHTELILAELGKDLASSFRYWEVLVVLDVEKAARYDILLQKLPNIRILKTLPNTNSYRRRVSAASEAIGDIVAMTAVEELPYVNICGMISRAQAEGSAVVGQWPNGRRILDPILATLGRSGGFRISTRDMQSAAFPRTILNRLLAHPNQQLALRFMPRDEALKVLQEPCYQSDGSGPLRSSDRQALRRRTGIIMQLLTDAAPRILGYSALASALMALVGLLFLLYAVIVWLTFDRVEPGWFTISIGISATMAFIGMVFFGICTGLAKILNILTAQAIDDVIDERSSVDLFGQLSQELNVASRANVESELANGPVKVVASSGKVCEDE